MSAGESAPEMAAAAARIALAASGLGPAEIDIILHANVYYQGHDLWSPASYIQRETVRNGCPALEIRQMSNGGMAALELAAAYLVAGRQRTAALLTTADRFCAPGFDRWRSDLGTVYGDGGTALVLSKHGGFARLRALATVSDSELERMHRGDDPFGVAPFSFRRPLDLEVPKRAFIASTGLSYSTARTNAGQAEAVKRALVGADIELSDVDWFMLPHFGRRRLESTFMRRLGITPDITTWRWGRRIGHLGAGDQFAGLWWLMDSGLATPGQHCLLIGIGAGFTWSCAVLEVLAPQPSIS